MRSINIIGGIYGLCCKSILFAAILATSNFSLGAQKLEVSSNGTPVYDFPVDVPPGIHGMIPNLSIRYTASGERGPVGFGWSLQGISIITRCRGNKRIDGIVTPVTYDVNDKLCIDGHRLIQTDATGVVVNGNVTNPSTTNPFQQNDSAGGIGLVREYRTEYDNFARVRAYGTAGGAAANGPAYFKVWTKSGQIYEYGVNSNLSSNSQIGTVGKTAVVAWAVSRISDPLGNYVDFQYDQRDVAWGTSFSGAGPTLGHEWNLSEIRYTGNGAQQPVNKILFQYTDRPDTPGSVQDRTESYRVGAKNVNIRRLDRIRTYTNWPASAVAKPADAIPVKTVKLLYDLGPVSNRSRLYQIAECAGDSDIKCLPATTFNYSAGGNVAYQSSASFKASPLATLPLENIGGTIGTITGDFFGTGRDGIIRWSDVPSENRLFRSEIDGTFTDVSPDKGGKFNIVDQNLFKSDLCYTTIAADFNGDGMTDLLRVTRLASKKDVACNDTRNILYTSRGDGSFDSKDIVGISFDQKSSVVNKRYNCAEPPTFGYLSSCQDPGDTFLGTDRTWGFNFYIVDVNNDGLLDIVTTELSGYIMTLTPPTYAQDCVTEVCTHIYLNQGNSTFSEIPTNLAHVSVYAAPANPNIYADQKAYVADINGDGNDDLIVDTAAYISRGDGNFDVDPNTINLTAGISTACPFPMDVNGDGMPDCLIPGLLRISDGTSVQHQATNFNLTYAQLYKFGTINPAVSSQPADFSGDGRSAILVVNDDPSQNTMYLSLGDGQFQAANSFNLKTASDQLQKSDGSASFSIGDFSGHGNVEILRMVDSPDGSSDAKKNALYLKSDSTPADQLISITSGTGLATRFVWVPLTNSNSGTWGARYLSDRGTTFAASYPVADTVMPAYVVATSLADSGVNGEQLTTEYRYTGLKVGYDGRGIMGFRTVLKQTEAQIPAHTWFRETTHYLQTVNNTGQPSLTEVEESTFQNVLISRTTNIYCDKTAQSGAESTATEIAPCSTNAKVQQPYLYKNIVEKFDEAGNALPKTSTVYLNDNYGNPTSISRKTEGTTVGVAQQSLSTLSATGYIENIAGDNWLIGLPSIVTITKTAPNIIDSITPSAGTAPNAAATSGQPRAALSVTLDDPNLVVSAIGAGDFSAIVTAIPKGGFAPYSYSWKKTAGTRTTMADTTLSAPTIRAILGYGENFTESWSVVMTDAIGSTASAQATINFQSLPQLTATISPSPSLVNAVSPGGPFYSPVTITPSGGVGPYTYRWSRVGGSRSNASSPSAQNPQIGAVLSYGDNFTEVWSVTVTDLAGHFASASVGITFTAPSAPALAFSNCTSVTPTKAPTGATFSCNLYNNGASDASSISLSNTLGVPMSGPSTCVKQSYCGVVSGSSPGTPGTYIGALYAAPNAGGTASSSFTVTVNQGDTSISASPSDVLFGTVGKTENPTRYVTIKNVGSYPVVALSKTLTNLVRSGGNLYLSSSGTCTDSIAVSGSCTIGISFDPGCTGGSNSATLNVGGANAAVIQLPVQGTGSKLGVCP